jgi:flagellar protein FlaG
MELSSVQSSMATVAGTPSPTVPEKVTEQRDLIRAVHALNAAGMFGNNRELSFSLDRETRRPVIRIIDSETKEVIQQIPQEYALRLAQNLSPGSAG